MQIVQCLQTSLEVLRGGCVLLLDLRAILNDQSELPVASWLTQAPLETRSRP